MAPRSPRDPHAHAPMYEQLLLFPERAEFLEEGRFDSYRVSLEHWKALAQTFRAAFEVVYERASARVLLVHGGQGHGKSLFVRTLEHDFRTPKTTPDPNNLWHALAGGSPPNIEMIRKAADTTALRRVTPRAGWLENERKFASDNKQAIRLSRRGRLVFCRPRDGG